MKEKGGMRSAKMPAEKMERNEGKLAPVSGMKYATDFGNPSDLDKASAGLANYAKKHKMKY